MPIDPNIYGMLRPAPLANPFDLFKQAQEMQALQEQRGALATLRQQQVTDLQNQQADRARKLQQQQQIDQVMQGALTKDPSTGMQTYDRGKLMTGMTQIGIAPDQMQAYLKVLDDSDAQITKARGAQADALKSVATLVDHTGNDPIVFKNEVQRAIANGLVSPQLAQPYLEAVARDPRHVSTITGALLNKQPELMDVAPGHTVIDKGSPQGGAVYTAPPETITPYQSADLGLRRQQLAQQLSLKQQKMAQQERLQNPLGAVMAPGPVAPAAAPTAAPAGSGAPHVPALQGTAASSLQDLHGADLLKAIAARNPGIASQVQALAEGRQQFPSSFALKYPYWNQMLSLVAQYDPSFDATNYNQRAQMRKDFTTGKSSQTINALNTVAQHLQQLKTASDALANGNTPLFNTVANAISKATGHPAVTNFDAVKTAVTDELTRVWRQSGGSEQDIKNWAASLNSSESPSQLNGALSQISELVGGKLSALQTQLHQAMGATTDLRVVTPQTEQILGTLRGPITPKASGSAGRIRVKGPNGESGTVPDGTPLPPGWSKVGG